jgi:hypothetical protein
MLKRLLNRYPPIKLGSMGVDWLQRRLSSQRRKLPDFMIIGGQRCGTTSMYSYLVQHPDVAPAFIKETHFFDRNYHKGVDWYRTYFPTQSGNGTPSAHPITGEATPIYLFHPDVPKRVSDSLPDAKLIILLRNPVFRAHSHYQMNVRLGIETRSFEDVVLSELTELEHVPADGVSNNISSRDHQFHFSYLQRGQYADQILRWQVYFKPEQFLVIQSEDFFRDTQNMMQDVFDFLELDRFSVPDIKSHNSGDYKSMPASIRTRLEAYFDPFNYQLNFLLGSDFTW